MRVSSFQVAGPGRRFDDDASGLPGGGRYPGEWDARLASTCPPRGAPGQPPAAAAPTSPGAAGVPGGRRQQQPQRPSQQQQRSRSRPAPLTQWPPPDPQLRPRPGLRTDQVSAPQGVGRVVDRGAHDAAAGRGRAGARPFLRRRRRRRLTALGASPARSLDPSLGCVPLQLRWGSRQRANDRSLQVVEAAAEVPVARLFDAAAPFWDLHGGCPETGPGERAAWRRAVDEAGGVPSPVAAAAAGGSGGGSGGGGSGGGVDPACSCWPYPSPVLRHATLTVLALISQHTALALPAALPAARGAGLVGGDKGWAPKGGAKAAGVPPLPVSGAKAAAGKGGEGGGVGGILPGGGRRPAPPRRHPPLLDPRQQQQSRSPLPPPRPLGGADEAAVGKAAFQDHRSPPQEPAAAIGGPMSPPLGGAQPKGGDSVVVAVGSRVVAAAKGALGHLSGFLGQ